MAGRRRCRVCWKLFMPDLRLGERQRTCGRDECRRTRHARNCAEPRGRDPDYTRMEQRIRSRLTPTGQDGAPGSPNPLDKLDWEAVRREAGTASKVVLQETGRVLLDGVMADTRKEEGRRREQGKVTPPPDGETR